MAKFVKISLRPFTECCPLLTKCGQHEAKPAHIQRSSGFAEAMQMQRRLNMMTWEEIQIAKREVKYLDEYIANLNKTIEEKQLLVDKLERELNEAFATLCDDR